MQIMGVQRRERLWEFQEMNKSFIEELALEEIVRFGWVEISVGAAWAESNTEWWESVGYVHQWTIWLSGEAFGGSKTIPRLETINKTSKKQ